MTVEVKIEKSVYGGDGLGRLGDGRVVFVAGAFAGETVRAEIFEQKKSFVKARLVEVVNAIPGRIPAAEVGPTVPGMVYANVSYADELRFKQDQLENFLWKIDSRVVPLDVVPAPSPLGYRNKTTYHVARGAGGKWAIGYQREGSHEVVDVESDPLASREINAALPGIRAGVVALLTQGAKSVRRDVAASGNVTVRHTAVDGVKWWFGDPQRGMELTERTAGLKFRVPADGFWQVNPAVGEELVKCVRAAYLDGAEAAPHVLDLYCGVGVFGLACMKAAANPDARLTGIESGRNAIADAKANAEAMGVKGSFFCERVGSSLGKIKVGKQTTVIVDPPRGGMEKNVPSWLAARPAPRVFYVSCDPATLVRDLAALAKSYEIRRVRLLDMFPRTARFETFVELARRDRA